MAHNFYQTPGGEDESYRTESRLLESGGHEIIRYEKNNDEIKHENKIVTAKNTIWNQNTYRELELILSNNNIEIAHFQNTFPIISPSAYYACQRRKIPVIQALRNYRITCINGMLQRNNLPCQDCVGSVFPLSGVVHRCYRDSIAASIVAATALSMHKIIGTYDQKVDVYIAISDYVKRVYVEAGIAPEKIFVKPNTVIPYKPHEKNRDNTFVYVGRLIPEKGIDKLLKEWSNMELDYELIVVGGGDYLKKYKNEFSAIKSIRFVGQLSRQQAEEYLSMAVATIVPSMWAEPFGRVVIESYAVGTPVIASNIGALPELIQDGETGMLFEPFEDGSISSKIYEFVSMRHKWTQMRERCLESYENFYSSQSNLEILEEIYKHAKR